MSLSPIPVELLTPRLSREVITRLCYSPTVDVWKTYAGYTPPVPRIPVLSADASVLYDAVQERITPRILGNFGYRIEDLLAASEPQELSDTGYIDETERWKPGPKVRSKNETAWRQFEKLAMLSYFKMSRETPVSLNLPQMWVWFSTPDNVSGDSSPYSSIRILFDRLVFWNMLYQHLPPPPSESDIDLWLVS